ncbi:hypothetical protein I7I48_06104 [Histoplasma ohiense]|nr:hypothetical protein I7I48_06104 [Histoplasma ohiense (nom. inval.)]
MRDDACLDGLRAAMVHIIFTSSENNKDAAVLKVSAHTLVGQGSAGPPACSRLMLSQAKRQGVTSGLFIGLCRLVSRQSITRYHRPLSASLFVPPSKSLCKRIANDA